MAIPRAEVVLEGYGKLMEVREKLSKSPVDGVMLEKGSVVLIEIAELISESPSHPCVMDLRSAADLVIAYRHTAVAVRCDDEVLLQLRERMCKALAKADETYRKLMGGWYETTQIARRMGNEPIWLTGAGADE